MAKTTCRKRWMEGKLRSRAKSFKPFKVEGPKQLPERGQAAPSLPDEPKSVPRRAWSIRLQRVAELCARASRASRRAVHLADIGCDHAWLCFALAELGITSFAVGVDRHSAPLASAASHASHPQRAHLAVELRQGDGTQPLKPSDNIDVAAIAGIGVPSICSILGAVEAHGKLSIRKLVLQPRAEWSAQLRQLLMLHGWSIVDEILHIENRAIGSALTN